MPDSTRDIASQAEFGLDHISDKSSFTRALINNTSAGIYVAQDRRFVHVNPFLEEITGYSAPEMIGQDTMEFVHPDDLESVRSNAIEALKSENGRSRPYEYRFMKKGGEAMWVIERVSSIDYNGRRAVLGSFMDINQQKLLEDELRKSEEKYRTILEEMEDAYYEMDLAGKLVFCNSQTLRGTGYSMEEIMNIHYSRCTLKEERGAIDDAFNKVLRTGRPNKGFEHHMVRKDGIIKLVEVAISPAKNEKNEVTGFHCVSRDITERKKLEDELVQSEEKYRTILREMDDAYYEVDLKGNYTFVNDACCRHLGYTRDELMGGNYSKVVPKEEITSIFNAFNLVYRTGKANEAFSHRTVRKDGVTGYAEASISLVKDKAGKVTGFRAVSRDVTERKRLEQRLAEMATHDYLTGLPNRILLNDRFYVAVARAHRNNSKLTLMSLDLDRFKAINDTMGHSAGDQLLKMAAIRLSYTLRSSDTVARIGGDEFVLLLYEIHSLEDATSVAGKIIESFKGPFIVEGHHLSITPSIGLAIYPDDGRDLDILMRKSDAAMYHAKKNGGNNYKIYSESDREELNY